MKNDNIIVRNFENAPKLKKIIGENFGIIRNKNNKSKHPFRELWRKIHRWVGLLVSLLVLNFAISGIILNHREELAFLDIPRNWMPQDYHYLNWNNAAVKSIAHTNQGSFIYGNIGIWKKEGTKFIDFNNGLPNGADNRNIHTMIETTKGNLYAGTLMGLYRFDKKSNRWQKINLPTKEQRVIKLIEKDNILYALTRNRIVMINEASNQIKFDIIELKEPIGYKKEASIFDTLWQIHSGEIFGLPGKLFMDLIGLVFIFVVISGLIKWYYPKTFKYLRNNSEKLKARKNNLKFNLRWHNKLGLWFGVIMILSALTGMFLRPPLLVLIASDKINQIPYTNLDQDNPWYDKFRNITWNNELNKWILATNESLYSVDREFKTKPHLITNHPPISVMGVNVLEMTENGGVLVGSFSGLFLWYPEANLIYDYVLKQPANIQTQVGPPIGAFAVSGYGFDEMGKEYYFDYNMGAVPLNSQLFFPKMNNQIIEKSKMSLWNAMLEFHTARIFKALVSDFYILIVPLSGLLIALTAISGLIVWFWVYKGKKF